MVGAVGSDFASYFSYLTPAATQASSLAVTAEATSTQRPPLPSALGQTQENEAAAPAPGKDMPGLTLRPLLGQARYDIRPDDASGEEEEESAGALPAPANLVEEDEPAEGADASGETEEAAPGKTPSPNKTEATEKEDDNGEAAALSARRSADGDPLTKEELEAIRSLEKQDAEIRQHEQAHIAAGGRYVRGGARFEYDEGPDGKRYAVGGEVSIDSSEESDPERTVEKMRVVQRAALAPARPSNQDRRVASVAARKELQAQMLVRAEQTQAMREMKAKMAERMGETDPVEESWTPEAASASSRKAPGESSGSASRAPTPLGPVPTEDTAGTLINIVA